MGIVMLKHQLWGDASPNRCRKCPPATAAHQTQSFQRRVQVGIITCQDEGTQICQCTLHLHRCNRLGLQSAECTNLLIVVHIVAFQKARCVLSILLGDFGMFCCSISRESSRAFSRLFGLPQYGGLSDHLRRHGSVSFQMCPLTVLFVTPPSMFKNLAMMKKKHS